MKLKPKLLINTDTDEKGKRKINVYMEWKCLSEETSGHDAHVHHHDHGDSFTSVYKHVRLHTLYTYAAYRLYINKAVKKSITILTEPDDLKRSLNTFHWLYDQKVVRIHNLCVLAP